MIGTLAGKRGTRVVRTVAVRGHFSSWNSLLRPKWARKALEAYRQAAIGAAVRLKFPA